MVGSSLLTLAARAFLTDPAPPLAVCADVSMWCVDVLTTDLFLYPYVLPIDFFTMIVVFMVVFAVGCCDCAGLEAAPDAA